MAKKPTDIDCTMTIGVFPYNDGSGFRFAVVASKDDDQPRVAIHWLTEERVEFANRDEWELVKAAVERALTATEEVGEDR